MAASVVQSKAGAENTGLATNTVTWDTPATAGNLLVVIVGSDDYVIAGGIPAGFTESTGCRQETFLGHYVWWKIAAGGETSTTYRLSGTFTSCWLTAEISGLTSSPFDISAGTLSTSSGSSFTTPAITPTTGDRWLAGSIGGSASAEVFSGVDTWTNSFVEIRDSFVTKASGTRDVTGLASRAVTGNGATTFSTGATYSGLVTARTRTGIILAFKVASGGTGATVTPSRVAATTTVPAPGKSASSTTTPARVSATAVVEASSRSAGSRATPGPVSGLAALPAPSKSTGSTVTAVAVAVAATVPDPQVQAGNSATVTAARVNVTTLVGATALSTGSRLTPDRLAASAGVSVPQVQSGSSTTVQPTPVGVTATVGSVSLHTGATVTAARVTAPSAVLTPVVTATRNAVATLAAVTARATVLPAQVDTVFVSITVRAGRSQRAWGADRPHTAWSAGPPTL